MSLASGYIRLVHVRLCNQAEASTEERENRERNVEPDRLIGTGCSPDPNLDSTKHQGEQRIDAISDSAGFRREDVSHSVSILLTH